METRSGKATTKILLRDKAVRKEAGEEIFLEMRW
jgi:hypothetical protein